MQNNNNKKNKFKTELIHTNTHEILGDRDDNFNDDNDDYEKRYLVLIMMMIEMHKNESQPPMMDFDLL